jgi:hypothetical protein
MTEEIVTKSWQRRGKKVNKHRNRDHKWGPGHVHWLRWISKHDESNVNGFGYWVRLCRMHDRGEHLLGGVNGDIGNVLKDEPVTCKICLNLEDVL